MRARHLLGLVLLAACANESGPAPQVQDAAWPLDGFLRYLPEEASVTLRLPSAQASEAGAPAVAGLLAMLGRTDEGPAALFYGAGDTAGLARDICPGYVLTTGGDWVHYLPAADKAALNRSLGAQAGKVAFREEEDWIILSQGGTGPGKAQGEPLPPGDLALRVRFHPLLDVFAQPGDTLEVGVELAGGGLELRGRLRPGERSATADMLARAAPTRGGLIDFLPAGLAVRVETTLPAVRLAGFLTQRIAAHCGIGDDKDRALLERFLREGLTGVDPEHEYAIGIEFHEGGAGWVAVGKSAKGPASPILARLRRSARTEFGALILDARDAPKGIVGLAAWVAQASPRLEGLPESAWPLLDLLSGGEQQGLPLAWAEKDDWVVLAGGPRADLLAALVRNRLRSGTSRSLGSRTLRLMRERAAGDYVLGVVVAPGLLAAAAQRDREALAGVFGAGANALPPRAVALAGVRRGTELGLEGRVLY